MIIHRLNIDNGLRTRFIGLIFVLYLINTCDEFPQHPGIVTEDNIVQWDSWKIQKRICTSIIAPYILVGTVAFIIGVIMKSRNICRSHVGSYNILFPLSHVTDFMLIVLLIMKKESEGDSIVLFFNSIYIYKCYEVDMSFVFRWIFSLFFRYPIIRIFVYLLFVIFQATLVITSVVFVGSHILNAFFKHVDIQSHIATIHGCEDSNRERLLPENASFHNFLYSRFAMFSNSSIQRIEKGVSEASGTSPRFINKEIRRGEYEDVSLRCEFKVSQIIRKNIDSIVVIWSYKGTFISNSSKYTLMTHMSQFNASANLYEVNSSIIVHALTDSDFGEYNCMVSTLSISRYCFNGSYSKDVTTWIMGRYFVQKQEKIPLKKIPVPVGNSLLLTWCSVDITNGFQKDEKDQDVSLYHTVDDKTIVSIENEENDFNECSILATLYYRLAYSFGFIQMLPYLKQTPSYVFEDTNGHLGVALFRCTLNNNLYGRHKVSLFRDFFNSSSNTSILYELELNQEYLIVPEKAHHYKTDLKNSSKYEGGYVTLSVNDMFFFGKRVIAELAIVIFLVALVACMGALLGIFYKKKILSPALKYILEGQTSCQLKHKDYDVAILCCENDRDVWMTDILDRLETTYNKSVFFIHRDFEYLAGNSEIDLYLRMYKEADCFILHITKSFLEDNGCLQLQLEFLLVQIKEKQISSRKVLIIHGDYCEFPSKIFRTLPDVTIHDWVQTKDNERRIKNINDWLVAQRKNTTKC